ncbi:MAG: toxin HicA [Xenococcus sp. MO_188.B8]|nr:toxin HicA [Xenococcus sp. MO_188.B8]
MAQIKKLLTQIRNNPQDVRFADLIKVCDYYFGEPRQKGTSHHVYRTPWQGDPRVNIQNKKGKAKTYQVKQVIAAIEKLEMKQDG